MSKLEYDGKITIHHLINGARQARGLAVVIDVFRAFSLECFLFSMGAKEIRPVETIEEAFRLKQIIPNSVLIGERNGIKCQGFDFGNSPSSIIPEKIKGKTIIHTTSAGTQGIVNAFNAEKIITGSLVNAAAIAKYIIKTQPQEVSLVAMGNSGISFADEDELCARYICSMLKNVTYETLDEEIKALRQGGGSHFFDENNQSVYPKEDFWMCIKYDIFPFVIVIGKDDLSLVAKKEDV